MREEVRLSIAYHEAGHVVAACSRLVWVYSATIVPEGDALGHVMHAAPLRGRRVTPRSSPVFRRRAETEIIVAIAGVEAQQRHGPLPWYGAGNDWQRAYNLARAVCLSDKEAFAYLKWLEIVAREQIEASWPDVEKVATALCERGTLSDHAPVRVVVA